MSLAHQNRLGSEGHQMSSGQQREVKVVAIVKLQSVFLWEKKDNSEVKRADTVPKSHPK